MDAEVVLASKGSFEFENEKSLGILALTHDKIYLILSKGFALQTP